MGCYSPKPTLEDIDNSSVSSMSGSSRDDLVSLPTFHCLIAQTNSIMS
jgi:hypothetical protein